MNIDEADEVIPLDIIECAQDVMQSSLPAKSKHIYSKVYDDFKTWMKKKKTNSFSQVVLLAYFKDLSTSMLPSTLWSKYSMLRTMLKLERQIDIESYTNLRLFLKRTNEGFKPKKSKIFSSNDIQKFLTDAPDDKFLDVKTALVIGVTGACRREELFNLLTDDITDEESHLVVVIQKTKTNITRTFTIGTPYREIVLNYLSKRPSLLNCKKFFLNYQKGKCTKQHIGINKLGRYPSTIASWLGLPEPKEYTGHSFRRTSATLLANSGASMTTLKRHGGWKSAHVAEGYIEDSINNKRKICTQITQSINYKENNLNIESVTVDVSTAGEDAQSSVKEISKNPVVTLNHNRNSSNIEVNVNGCIMQ